MMYYIGITYVYIMHSDGSTSNEISVFIHHQNPKHFYTIGNRENVTDDIFYFTLICDGMNLH